MMFSGENSMPNADYFSGPGLSSSVDDFVMVPKLPRASISKVVMKFMAIGCAEA